MVFGEYSGYEWGYKVLTWWWNNGWVMGSPMWSGWHPWEEVSQLLRQPALLALLPFFLTTPSSWIVHYTFVPPIILHTCVNFSFWYFRLIEEQCIIHVAGAVNAFSFVERRTACLRKSSYNKVWCAPITGRWRNVLEIDQSSSSERAPRSFLSGCRLFLDSSRQLEITKNNFATFTFYQKIKAGTNRPLKNFQTSFHFHCFQWKFF